MPRKPAREVGRDVLAPLGVVEDQQPARVGPQPAKDGGGPDVLIGLVGLKEIQLAGEVGEGRGEHRRVLGGEPEDGVVVFGVAVGELDGQQRLADTAQAVDADRLRQRRAPEAASARSSASSSSDRPTKSGSGRRGTIQIGPLGADIETHPRDRRGTSHLHRVAAAGSGRPPSPRRIRPGRLPDGFNHNMFEIAIERPARPGRRSPDLATTRPRIPAVERGSKKMGILFVDTSGICIQLREFAALSLAQIRAISSAW